MSKNAVCYTVIVICVLSGLSFAKYSGGTGDPNDPYLIATPNDLNAIGLDSNDWDKHFKMVADINLQEQGVTIGNSTTYDVPFTGSFNGNENSIINLRVINSNGLFWHIKNPNTIIRDLTLINPYVEGGNKTGALIGYLESGSVINCHVIDGYIQGYDYVGGLIGDSNESLYGLTSDAQVIGRHEVGGLVGYNPKIIENCFASGQVSGIQRVGGLVGSNGNSSITSGEIIDCLATADVNCVNANFHSGGYFGGLTGMSYGRIHGSRATGNIKCDQLCNLGGLAGWSNNIISNSTAGSSVSGGSNSGGLVGYNCYPDGQIISCNATGTVINYNTASSVKAGGLVGENRGLISNCFASGKVEGNDNLGGLVGLNWDGNIIKCYSEGEVIGTSFVGGLIGYHLESDVFESYALGKVTGNSRTGGLIGQITNHHGTTNVVDCHATGDVNGIDDIGGLVGLVYMGYEGNIYVSRCYSSGRVTADTKAGGLVGRVENDDGAAISKCFSTSDLYLTSDYGGGLIGYADTSTVENCYARGGVTGSAASRYLGGLIGYKDRGSVTNSYATGDVKGDAYMGGLAGYEYGSDRFFNCYWDIETGGPDNGIGTGLPTSEMQLKSTYTTAKWNFTYTWKICEGTNYPKLAWQVPPGDFVCPDGVDFIDYSFFANHWMVTNCADANDCDGTDLDFSGMVDYTDLKIFFQHWLDEK